MATVDSLDIQIAASARKANDAINGLIKNLGMLSDSLNIDTSGLEKIGKSINIDGISKSIKRQSKEITKSASQVAGEFQDKFKNISVKVDFSKPESELKKFQKQAQTAENALSRVMASSSADKQVKGIEKWSISLAQANNAISILENHLAEMQKKKISVDIGGSENVKNLIERMKTQIRQSMEGIRIKNPIDLASLSEKDFSMFTRLKSEMEQTAQSAKNMGDHIKESVSNIGFQSYDSAEIQKFIDNYASASTKISDLGLRTEQFEQSLKNLQIPPINTENINVLQRELAKSEANFEKLRAKLANGITMGRISANVDDKGYRNLREQMELAEKRAQALQQKIQEMGDSAGGGESKVRKLDRVLSGISLHSNKASDSTNLLRKNVKSLSSAMNGFNKTAKRAAMGMKSFTKQALSAIGISFGLYESVKGIKNAVENSMNYVETLNYFNAAFQQVAENTDLSGWKDAGYDSAEVYADSFRERAKQLTSKLTGFEVSDAGELTRTTMPSLGLDPDKTMQYQATFAQMASSMGTTSDAALKVSNALTMIGADLASVRNLDFDKVWEDMASGLAGMSRTLDKYGANIRDVNLQQKLNSLGINESITKINQQDKALLRTIILLESTKYAWGDLSKTVNQPANQVRLLESNFKSLSRTIGSLFIPTITKVLPYINAMVMALQRFFAWIAKTMGIKLSDFTASMGGMSDSVSGLLDMEDDATGAADAVDKTTDSVKQLEKSLSVLSFDELHQLSAPQKDDKGENESSNKIPDYSDVLGGALDDALSEYQRAWDKAFSEMSNKANEIADKIAEAVKKAWERADFSDIGAFMGGKIKDALDNIPWTGIQSAVSKIGKSLATLINGAIEVPGLGYAVGKTIAEAINTGLIGIESFAKNLHWESVGRFLGNGVNGALKNINWKTALSAAKHMGSGIGRAINSFMARTDFSLVGKTAANAINTAIQFALSAGTTIDFKTFGKKISDAINGFFKTFDATKAAKAINAWLIGALSAASTMLKNTDFNAIGRKIGEFLVGIDLTEAIKGLASTVWEAIKGAFGMISSVFSEAPLEASLISAFAILKFTGLGKKVAGNIAFSIGSSIESSMVNSGFATNLQTGIAKAATGAVAAFAEFSVIKGVFSDLNSLSDITIEDIGKIAGAATAAGTVMTAVFGFPAGVIATALAGVAGAFAGVIEKNEELARKLKEEEEISRYGQTISDMSDNLHRSSEEIRDRMKAADEYIKTAGIGEMNMAKDLSEEYFKLADKQSKTNKETDEMKRLAGLLVDTMPELSQYYNEQTGLLETTKDNIDKLIQSRLQEIQLNAVEEQLTQAYKDQAVALMNLEDVAQVMNDKQAQMNELKQKYDEALEKSTMLQKYEELSAKIQTAQGDTSDLIQEQENLAQKLTSGGTEEFPTFQSIQREVEKSAQDLTDFQGEYQDVVDTFTEQEETYNALGKNVSRWKEMVVTGMKSSAEEGIAEHNGVLRGDSSMVSAQVETASKAVHGGVSEVKRVWGEKAESIKDTITGSIILDSHRENELKSEFSGYGALSAKGIEEGIKNSTGKTTKATEFMVQHGLISPFKSKLDIHSPSKVFEGFGKNVVVGLKNGIDNKASTARTSIEILGGGLEKSIKGSLRNVESNTNTAFGKLNRSFNSAETNASNSASRIANAFSGIRIPLPHIGFDWDNWNFGDFSLSVPKFRIDWYAKGGLFSGASVIGVGEAGPEAVLPLSNTQAMSQIAESIYANAPENGATGLDKEEIKQAVIEGMVTAMMMNSKNLTPVVNCNCYATLKTENDEVLARAVARGQNSLNYRLSPT